MPLDSRLAALRILNTLDQGQQTLDQIIDAVFPDISDFPQRDKNLLFAIVYGVLRQQLRLDWVLSHYLKTELDKLDTDVRNILRAGLFQVIFLSRVPVSAAVNTSVELAKTLKKPWIVKFVNGVLRHAVRGYESLALPDRENDPAFALAIEQSMPLWMVNRWLVRLGLPHTLLLCEAINTIPPVTVRTNTLKTTRHELLEAVRVYTQHAEATTFSPDGIRLYRPSAQVFSFTDFKEGLVQVQDEAAQLVTLLLDPLPEEAVLDSCAGVGGKTGHIAQQMKNRGKVMALDINPDRLAKIRPEMRRLGISIVDTGRYDFCQPEFSGEIGQYDRVLLDAPCSGMGVLRRNPDTKWKTFPERLAACRSRQMKLLDSASRFVKPDGVLVYAVCSVEPEENEDVISDFLGRHREYHIEKNTDLRISSISHLIDDDGYLRTFPHLHNMDGFFAVRFKRTA